MFNKLIIISCVLIQFGVTATNENDESDLVDSQLNSDIGSNVPYNNRRQFMESISDIKGAINNVLYPGLRKTQTTVNYTTNDESPFSSILNEIKKFQERAIKLGTTVLDFIRLLPQTLPRLITKVSDFVDNINRLAGPALKAAEMLSKPIKKSKYRRLLSDNQSHIISNDSDGISNDSNNSPPHTYVNEFDQRVVNSEDYDTRRNDDNEQSAELNRPQQLTRKSVAPSDNPPVIWM